uniref:Uncharacterized protein n=1 Tax=Megaviridae environmental sample TaxID=1737588 RepID=A0A5J6VKI2_9VIRU|nr:MAG: hypothetical protein [Megaviridae environmental sample]
MKTIDEIEEIHRENPQIMVDAQSITVDSSIIPQELGQMLTAEGRLDLNCSLTTASLLFMDMPSIMEAIIWQHVHCLSVDNIELPMIIMNHFIDRDLGDHSPLEFTSMNKGFRLRLYGCDDYDKVRVDDTDEIQAHKLATVRRISAACSYPLYEGRSKYKHPNIFYDRVNLNITERLAESSYDSNTIVTIVDNIKSISFDHGKMLYYKFLANPMFSEALLRNKYLRNAFTYFGDDYFMRGATSHLEPVIRDAFHGLLVREMQSDTKSSKCIPTFDLEELEGIPLYKDCTYDEGNYPHKEFLKHEHPFINQICDLKDSFIFNYKKIKDDAILTTYEKAVERFDIFAYGLFSLLDKDTYDRFFDVGDTKCTYGGSMLAACLAPRSPDFDFESHVEEFYKDSDIDCAVFVDDLEAFVQGKIDILNEAFNNARGGIFSMAIKENRIQIVTPRWARFPTIEYYSVYGLSPADHYSKYHFGFVRGWWDGYKITLLPSAVISVLSMVSVDIRFCSTKHLPQDLIHKYMMRGFNFVMNPREISHYVALYGDENAKKLITTPYNEMRQYFLPCHEWYFGVKAVGFSLPLQSMESFYN